MEVVEQLDTLAETDEANGSGAVRIRFKKYERRDYRGEDTFPLDLQEVLRKGLTLKRGRHQGIKDRVRVYFGPRAQRPRSRSR